MVALGGQQIEYQARKQDWELLEAEGLNNLELVQTKSVAMEVDQVKGMVAVPDKSRNFTNMHEDMDEQKTQVISN